MKEEKSNYEKPQMEAHLMLTTDKLLVESMRSDTCQAGEGEED